MTLPDRAVITEVYAQLESLNNRVSDLEKTARGRLLSPGNGPRTVIGTPTASPMESDSTAEKTDKKIKALAERLLALEQAVERENETSMQVLDVLLSQKQQPPAPQQQQQQHHSSKYLQQNAVTSGGDRRKASPAGGSNGAILK